MSLIVQDVIQACSVIYSTGTVTFVSLITRYGLSWSEFSDCLPQKLFAMIMSLASMEQLLSQRVNANEKIDLSRSRSIEMFLPQFSSGNDLQTDVAN